MAEVQMKTRPLSNILKKMLNHLGEWKQQQQRENKQTKQQNTNRLAGKYKQKINTKQNNKMLNPHR